MRYVSVCGRGVVGATPRRFLRTVAESTRRRFTDGNEAFVSEGAPTTLASVGAGVSYAASCGSCDGVDGDGVTPLRSAMLRGATEIVLEGVTHKAKPTRDESGDAWYGAAPVVRTWAPELFA